MNETKVTVKLTELGAFVKELLLQIPAYDDRATVIALCGDLGAGKTTFVKTLAKELGVTEEVTSPTFTILQAYETHDTTWKQLLHMDAYRIESLDELGPLRFTELLTQPHTLFCIEWAEHIAAALPNVITLNFEAGKDEEARTIQINSDL